MSMIVIELSWLGNDIFPSFLVARFKPFSRFPQCLLDRSNGVHKLHVPAVRRGLCRYQGHLIPHRRMRGPAGSHGVWLDDRGDPYVSPCTSRPCSVSRTCSSDGVSRGSAHCLDLIREQRALGVEIYRQDGGVHCGEASFWVRPTDVATRTCPVAWPAPHAAEARVRPSVAEPEFHVSVRPPARGVSEPVCSQ